MNDDVPTDPDTPDPLRLTDAEADELLGVYALDAIDDDAERAALERHLAASPEARAELRRLREAMDEVVSATAATPREALWDTISAHLTPAATAPPIAPIDAAHAGSVAPSPITAPGTAPGTAPITAPITSLHTRRSMRGARGAVLAAAAAVLLVLAGALVGRGLDDDRDNDLAAELRAAADRAAAASDSRSTTLTGPAGSVRIVIGDGRTYVDADLAPLPEGRTYQLWTIDEDTPVSLGLLGRSPSIALIDLGTARSLAVTAEPVGGSQLPTSDVVASGEI